MIYDGNVRFEHCYRLDLDTSIAPTHRRACWQDWLQKHTYGQTGDRLAHARRRLSDLDRGDQATLALKLDAGAEPIRASAGAPLPTSIHAAPPPKSVEPTMTPAAASATSANQPPASPPEDDCAHACRETWSACAPICGNSAAPNSDNDAGPAGSPSAGRAQETSAAKTGCAACGKNFKACMRRCYR
jgi:hypothetical protein